MIDPSDAVANDVQYHFRCWIYGQQKAVPKTEYSYSDSNQSNVTADIEIINIVKCALNYPSETVLIMYNVNTTYVDILQDNNQGNIQLNYKRHLNELLLQNIPNIEFINVKKNEPEKICSTKQKG